MNRPIDPDDLRGALHDLAASAPTGDDALLTRTHERIAVHRRRRIAGAVAGGIAALALVVGGVAVLASDDDGLLVETPDPADTPTTTPDPDGVGAAAPPDGILAIDMNGDATVYDADTLQVDEVRTAVGREAFAALGGGVLELHHTGGSSVVAVVDRDDPEGCMQVAQVGVDAAGAPVVTDLARSNDATASPAGAGWLIPCPAPDDVEVLRTDGGQTTRFGEARLQEVRDLALSADDRLAAVSCTDACRLTVAAYDPDPVGQEPGPWPFVTPEVALDDGPCEAGDAARVAWLGDRIAVWTQCATEVTWYAPDPELGYVPDGVALVTGDQGILALDGEPSGARLLAVVHPERDMAEGTPSLVVVGADDPTPRTVAEGVVAATWIWSDDDAPTEPTTSTTPAAPDTTTPVTSPDTSSPDTTTAPSGPVTVPDVVGMDVVNASDMLADVGFTADVVDVLGSGDVYWQEPPAGAIVGPANRVVTVWTCGPGAECVIPPPSWLDDPSTTAWAPLTSPVWDDLVAGQSLGGTVDDALATITAAFEPTSEIWSIHPVVLPDAVPGTDQAAASADVLLRIRGLGDDTSSGADIRLTLVHGVEGWTIDHGEQRSRCTRGVTTDGLGCV